MTRLIQALRMIMGFSLALGLSQAFAESPSIERFRHAGASIPAALEQLGYQEFGFLNLSEFISHVHSIEVTETQGWSVAEKNRDGRASGHWEPNHVWFSRDHLAQRPEQLNIFALHEFLCADGFQDEQYAISMKLWFLALPQMQAALSRQEVATLESKLAGLTRKRVAGGVVGVGGGGEVWTLAARTQGVRWALEKLARAQSAEDREIAVDEVSRALTSNASVAVVRQTKAFRQQQKRIIEAPRAAVCMTPSQTCSLGTMRGLPASSTCTCPGQNESGILAFPHD